MLYLKALQMELRFYFRSGFNILIVTAIVLYFIGLGLQHGTTVECYEAARIFRAVDFIAFSYMLLQYMSVWEKLGIMLPMLRRMVWHNVDAALQKMAYEKTSNYQCRKGCWPNQ